MKTDTPRTDEQHAQFQMGGFTLDFARQLERELTAVTEQRDRLAEAMTRIKNIYENPGKWCIPSSSDMYDEAIESLESLTTKTSTD
jgi:hypothetical protein